MHHRCSGRVKLTSEQETEYARSGTRHDVEAHGAMGALEAGDLTRQRAPYREAVNHTMAALRSE